MSKRIASAVRSGHGRRAVAMASSGFLPRRQIKANKVRNHTGVLRAMFEMRIWQRNPHILFPKTAFTKIVKYIAQGVKVDMRFSEYAILALGEAAQAHVHEFIRLSEVLRMHRGKETANKADFKLAKDMANVLHKIQF